MIDFDPILDQRQATSVKAPVITETVTITPVRSERTAFVGKPDGEWGWDDLRDFVIKSIEDRHGPQIRDFKKEASIFKGFLSRWSDKAPAIARAAFEPPIDGMWRGAPISVNRFCKASDPFFAEVLAERL